MKDSELNGKVVVVTGASSGLGRAIVNAFAEEHAKVALLARKSPRLDDAAEELKQVGVEVLAIPTDVGVFSEVDDAARQVVEKWGKIDVWVNNAMVGVFCYAWDVQPDEFKRVVEVTFLGQVYGTMAALKHMRPRNEGTIIFVGSALAYRGIPLQSAYCSSKHAIQGFYDSLRTELLHTKSNIKISMVQLPAMNTPQFNWVKSCLPNKPRPMGTIYQPEVIAKGVKYLAAHPRRELFIGFSTFKTIIGNKLLPVVADKVLAKNGIKGQQTSEKRDPNRKFNLWSPSEAHYSAHGDFDSQAKTRSLTMEIGINRTAFWSTVLVVGSFIGLGIAKSLTKGR